MRLPALLGPWLPLLIATIYLLTIIRFSHAITSPQKFLVCRDSKFQRCITWLTNIDEALELARKLYVNNEFSDVCGVSDLVPISPHRKFIRVLIEVEDKPDTQLFCNLWKIKINNVRNELWSKSKIKVLNRIRRQTAYGPRGRYRGQTQSQYLAIDRGAGNDNGKAEAHSAADSSRASVSGSSGMGQAQSQTMYDPSCEDCVARSDLEAENLKRGPYIPTQSSVPGGTSVNGGLQAPGGISAQNRPGHYGSNQNGPGGYGLSPTGGSPNTNGYRQNQQGAPGRNGVLLPNQQGSGQGNFIPNKDAPNFYYQRPSNTDTSGTPGHEGFSPNRSPGQGIYNNNNFIPSIADKPSGGSYDLHQNGIPGNDGRRFPPNQSGSTGESYIPSTSGDPGVFMPNHLAGNGYMPNQQGTSGGPRVYGSGQNGQPSSSLGAVPRQTVVPDGSYRQGSYLPSGEGPAGGGSDIYKVIQNGAERPLQSAPRILDGNNQYSSEFPGTKVGYNTGTNWPVTTGMIQGPDGTTYYCCVAGPNNHPQYYKTGGSTGQPSIPTILGGLGSTSAPNNLMAPPNLYSPGVSGLGSNILPPIDAGQNAQFLPGSVTSGLRPGYIQPGIEGQSGLIRPDGQLTPGGSISQNTLQTPTSSQTGLMRPGGHYGVNDNQNGILTPGGHYSPGGSGGQNGLLSPVGQYGRGSSVSPTGLQSPGGQYNSMDISRQPDLKGTNGQYGPGGVGGVQGPAGQYGSEGTGVQRGLQSPLGQYSPGSSGSQSGLPGLTPQYSPGNTGGQSGLSGTNVQYSPGAIGGQSGPPGIASQYGTGGRENPLVLPGTLGQYSPGVTGGQSSIPGQYGPGSGGVPSGLTGSVGQYNPQFTGSQSGIQGPGAQQSPGNTGSLTGQPGPSAQYAPGGTGSQSALPGQGGQYSPGEIAGQTSQYGPGNTEITYRPGGIGGQGGQFLKGQYRPGDTSDQNGLQSPGGQYSNTGPGGQHAGQGPSELYGSGIMGGQNGLGSQYGQGGQYIPSSHVGPGVYGSSPYGYDNQGNLVQSGNYNGPPQNVVDPNSLVTDGDDSEAEASVTQGGNGTVATAASKGGNEKGRAQTHVHGAYTGSGSFSAQAEISGENKAANSEVAGDKKGASSQAQGSGRNNKSQANVQLGSETGSVLTGSQSEGVMHSSNTQVQGSVKGGMADAQARGPGSTSSQAQIGFTPYKEGDTLNEQQAAPFIGGGTAQAQSSGRTGSSQSQLRGSFKYGITYNGAAQAGASLDKDAVFPNRLPFDKIDVYDENNKNINVNLETTIRPLLDVTPTEESMSDKLPVPGDITEVMSSSEKPFEAKLGPDEVEEEIEQHNSIDEYEKHAHSDHHKDILTPNPSRTPAVEGRRSFQPTYNNNNADYDYGPEKDDHPTEDYDIDGYGTEGGEPSEVEQYELPKDSETHQSLNSPKRKGLEVRQTTGGNAQHIVLGSLNDQDAEITQRNSERPDESKVYQPGERIPGTGGYIIPVGFTGSVKSVASKENTYVVGTKDSPSQAQTVSLTPGNGKVKYIYPATHPRNISPKDLRSLYNPKADDNRYISVSKSVTRSLDDENNIRKQYSHTYYTKSSSCGYFTFTCTMVSSAEGRKKVCKPKIPTNPDGSPMRC